MNYFKPGFREISRKFGRQLTRLQIVAERRKLAKAETELGLLGWQQADFDLDTQLQVDKLKNYEREQSCLINEGAAFGQTIRSLRGKREAARRAFEEERRRLLAEQAAQREPLERLRKQLLVYRKQEPQYQKRIPELDRELREVQRLYTECLALESPSAQAREDLVRLRERTVAIPNEKADLRTQHMRMASEIKALEAQIQQNSERVEQLETALKDLETAFEAQDRETATEIRAKERGKAKIDREIDTLDEAKANPYRQIGRVLADSGLAPMNQPHALDKVRRYREGIDLLDSKIQISLGLSSEVNPEQLQTSYQAWGILGATALLLLVLVWVLR